MVVFCVLTLGSCLFSFLNGSWACFYLVVVAPFFSVYLEVPKPLNSKIFVARSPKTLKEAAQSMICTRICRQLEICKTMKMDFAQVY